MTDSMIERVARVLCRCEGQDPDAEVFRYGSPAPHWKDWEPRARAAIEALREPTQAMLDAPYKAQIDAYEEDTYRYCWQEMIDAALKEGT